MTFARSFRQRFLLYSQVHLLLPSMAREAIKPQFTVTYRLLTDGFRTFIEVIAALTALNIFHFHSQLLQIPG